MSIENEPTFVKFVENFDEGADWIAQNGFENYKLVWSRKTEDGRTISIHTVSI